MGKPYDLHLVNKYVYNLSKFSDWEEKGQTWPGHLVTLEVFTIYLANPRIEYFIKKLGHRLLNHSW